MQTNMCIVTLVILSLFIAGAPCIMAEEAPQAASQEGQTVEEATLLDINSATAEELETLPGIGPKLAKAILDGRPYQKIEDLLEVKGIAEKKLAQFKDLITVIPVNEPQQESTTETEE